MEALYGGPTRCGKTAALLLAALRFSRVRGYAALILRRTRPELMQPDGPAALAHEWLAGVPGAKWNGNDFRWTFSCPGGGESILVFGYLDAPDDHTRYQGGAYQFFGFDELTHFREPQYRWLFSRLSKRTSMGGIPTRFRSTANPGGRGHAWVKERFGLHGIPATPVYTPDEDGQHRVFIPGKLEDNPGVDHATTRAGLRRLDAATRAQLEDGDWDVVPGGKVFTAAPLTYPSLPTEGLAYGIGVDIAATPGGGDWSCAVVLARKWVPNNGVKGHWRVYVVDVIRKQVAAPEFGKALALLRQRYPSAVWRSYVAGGDIIAEQWLRTTGVQIGAVSVAGRNKLMRAQPAAAAWNGRDPDPNDPADAGEPQRVYVPERGAWVTEFVSEHLGFTGDGKGHDDQVDALAAAFDVLSVPPAAFTTAAPRTSALIGSTLVGGTYRDKSAGF